MLLTSAIALNEEKTNVKKQAELLLMTQRCIEHFMEEKSENNNQQQQK